MPLGSRSPAAAGSSMLFERLNNEPRPIPSARRLHVEPLTLWIWLAPATHVARRKVGMNFLTSLMADSSMSAGGRSAAPAADRALLYSRTAGTTRGELHCGSFA